MDELADLTEGRWPCRYVVLYSIVVGPCNCTQLQYMDGSTMNGARALAGGAWRHNRREDSATAAIFGVGRSETCARWYSVGQVRLPGTERQPGDCQAAVIHTA